MIALLRKMSSEELQELVDLVAGCTCSNIKSDDIESEQKEALVYTNFKEYYGTIIFNLESANRSIERYASSIENYVIDSEKYLREYTSELSVLNALEKEGFDVEKAAIANLQKKIEDLQKIIKEKIDEKDQAGGGTGRTGLPSSGVPGTTPKAPRPTNPRMPPAPPQRPTISTGRAAAGAAAAGAMGGMVVTGKFGEIRPGRTTPHEGTDYRARTPKPIYAMKEGKVVFAGTMRGYGNTVIVEHDDVKTLYGHLSDITVKKGDTVKPGQSMGSTGSSGGNYTPHLHFEVRKKDSGDKGMGTPIDSEQYFKENPNVYAPLAPTPNDMSHTEAERPSVTSTIKEGKSYEGRKKEYYNKVYNALHKEAKKAGVKNPEVIATLGASQSSLETGFGENISGRHNYFGIKAQRGEAGTTQATKEFDPRSGTTVNTTGKFKNYKDFDESAADYIKFLQTNPRYKNVLESKTVEKAIEEQGKTGYASAPDYAEKLSSITSRGMSTIPEKKASTSQVASAPPELIRRISKQNTKTIIQPIIIQK